MLKRSVILLVCLLSWPVIEAAKEVASEVASEVAKPNAKSCREVAKKVKRLESTMRQGYTVKKGEQLKRKMRKLKKQRYLCHKARLPTK